MRREDWLWLVIKAAGVWLVVTAVEVMRDVHWSWFSYGEHDVEGKEQLLRVLVPLAAGLLLLFVDFSRWLPVAPAAGEAHAPDRPATELTAPQRTSPQHTGWTREDVLWVGFKVVGAAYLPWAVWMTFSMALYGVREVFGWTYLVAGVPMLGIALWLLFGERLWRIAAVCPRGAQTTDADAEPRRRRRSYVAELVPVLLLLLLLIALPVLFLWWIASGKNG